MSAGLSAVALSALATGCVEEVPEVIEELELANVLTPSSTSAVVDASTGTTVNFTWTNSNAANYHLEVYAFDLDAAPASAAEITDDVLAGMTPVVDTDVAPSESGSSTSYRAEGLEPEMSYYARVCAQSSADPDAKTAGDSKWAVFPYPIDTYSVMDQLPSFGVKERTSTTISVQWTVEDGDEYGVNQLRVSPHPTDAAQAFLQVPVESGAVEATVEGLNPSEKYTVALHYNSANRGQMFVWTTPDWTGVAEAADTATLKQFLRDAGQNEDPSSPLRIKLTNREVPYDLGTVDVLGPVEILGEQSVDGDSPVVIGKLKLLPAQTDYKYSATDGTPSTIPSTVGATYLRVEAIEFDGDSYAQEKPLQVDGDFPAESPLSIYVVNCDIHGYKHGIFYDNSKVATYTTITIENSMISDILGDGGDGFDIRAESTVNNVTMRNNTLSNGMRSFIRIDKGTLGSLVFENNTVNNICSFDNSNNKGLFNIRAALSGAFQIKKNLFLNLTGVPARTVMFPAQAAAFPTEVSGNYYYNLADTFFYDKEVDKCPSSDEFPESSAVAGGGAVLTADPCENSVRGIFNVTDAAVLAAKAGDPRWLVEYIPQPIANLEPVAYGEWNLTDKSAYGQSLEETTVINNTKFIVDLNPINILDEGMEFSAEATLQYGGVPSDCAIAFLVDKPGSIFASSAVSGSGTVNDHITVAIGDADGNAATVAGSIFAGASNQKIVFDDIDEPQLIYLYACGPVILTDLEWSDDVNTGSSALKDPEVTFDASTAGALTLSWNAVKNAGSYIISFGVKEPDAVYAEDEYIISGITGTSYTWEAFPSGIYTVNVQAVPAELDKFENSMIVGKEVTVNAPAQTPMTSGSITREDMEFLLAVVGNGEIQSSIYYKNFLFTSRSGKIAKFNSNDALGAFFNVGGSSDVTEDNPGRTIRFIAAGAGKLTYVTVSNSSDTDRSHAIAQNYVMGTVQASKKMPSSTPASLDDYTISTELSVASGTVIDLAGSGDALPGQEKGNGNVNFLSVTWEPAGGLPPVAGLIPVTETTTWGSPEWKALFEAGMKNPAKNDPYERGKDIVLQESYGDYIVINNLMVYCGNTYRVGADDAYYQFSGGSFNDDKEQPMDYDQRFFRFRVAGNGTLTINARGSGGGQTNRNLYVAVGGSADQGGGIGVLHETVHDVGPNSNFENPVSWEISASNGDSVTIFANDGLRVSQITWTPAE